MAETQKQSPAVLAEMERRRRCKYGRVKNGRCRKAAKR